MKKINPYIKAWKHYNKGYLKTIINVANPPRLEKNAYNLK